jgi:poly-gamma-glutamate synthesis protein (capsule biosynthesis protein)
MNGALHGIGAFVLLEACCFYALHERMYGKMKKRRWVLPAFVLLLLAAASVIWVLSGLKSGSPAPAGNNPTPIAVEATPLSEDQNTPAPMPSPTPEPVFAEAVWIGVGDIMSHAPQLPGAYDAATKSYNFDPYFEPVKPILQSGDWVMANLETPIGGPDFGYTGYPSFNAPFELAEALKNAGFNMLSTANNHSLDKGERGLRNTIDNLKELGFSFAGTAASQEEADAPVLVERNGITMGILSYTYGTNGIPIPEGKPYLVNLISEEAIKSDIKKLRGAGADLVTVALHFGIEYQTSPSEEQKNLARSLAASGADIIAGSHPHVVQPYEMVESFDEDGNRKECLIIYSMGNFISNQRGESKDYGVIFKVSVSKNMTEGGTVIKEVEAIPTWVHRYKPDKHFRYRILPVEDVLAASNDDLLTPTDYETLQRDLAMLNTRLESMK